MPITCGHCHRVLNFSGDPPSFCGYCGLPLMAPTESSPYTETSPTDEGKRSGTAASDAMPTSIGGYRLIRRLGAGGMGTVYEAEDVHTGRHVAIKLLAERLSEDPAVLERFRQEGRIASAISHPRCVFVVAADEERGRPYIVMELMPSFTLRDLVGGMGGPMVPEDAVARILEVIDGLQEAHRLGVLHRDVKPSNCFMLEDGTCKIGDFGLSKSLHRDTHLTQSGAYVGTVLYSSPEQLRNDPLDFRSDIYSVAATLFFLLTGQAPFPYESTTEAVARIASEPPPDVRQFRPDIPMSLARIVRKGLQRDRDRRWQTLAEMRAALARLVPSQLSTASLGLRVGAVVIDEAILALRLLLPLQLLTEQTAYYPLLVYIVHIAISFTYFAVLEGLWGCTLGKKILRLRVARLERLEPPGLRRTIVRTGVCAIVLVAPQVLTWLPLSQGGLLLGQASMLVLGVVAVAWPMRSATGFRGLHELASGTRTVQLPWPERGRSYAARQAMPSAQPRPDSVPENLGPYGIVGLYGRDGERCFLVGEDHLLNRRVLINLAPPGEKPADAKRHDLARPARLRWLASGLHDGRQWDAFVAPAGCPVPALVAPGAPRSWAGTRPLLEQLAQELSAAETDGSLPETLSLEQVWVQADGRLLLLDEPFITSMASSALQPLQLLRQAAVLLLESQPMTQERAGSIRAPVPQHAQAILDRLLDGARGYQTPTEFARDLAATRGNAREVSFNLRLGHLWVLGILLLPGLVSMFATSDLAGVLAVVNQTDRIERTIVEQGHAVTDAQNKRLEENLTALREQRARQAESLSRVGRFVLGKLVSTDDDAAGRRVKPGDLNRVTIKQLAQRIGAARDEGPQPQVWVVGAAFSSPVLFWPIVWTIWAFLFRGGFSLPMMGLFIVRADGRRAGRLRCAFRAALVWLPLVGLLLAANGLILGSDLRLGLAHTIWWAAGGLLGVYCYTALLYPKRSLHDILAGTWLVPK